MNEMSESPFGAVGQSTIVSRRENRYGGTKLAFCRLPI